MGQLEINLRDLFRVIRKRKWLIIVAPILMGVATLAFTEPPRPIYTAETLLKITRSTTVAGLMTEYLSYSVYDNMATQIMVITSQPILEEVALELMMIRKGEDSRDAVEQLKGRISAEQRGSSDILAIKAKAPSQEQATTIANTVAEVYIRRSSAEKGKRLDETIVFLQSRLKETTEGLLEAEQALTAFQRENAGTLHASGNLGLDAQEKEVQYVQKLKDLRASIAAITRIQQSREYDSFLQHFIPTDDSGIRVLSEEITRRLATLSDLRIKRTQMLSYQTESAPQVLTQTALLREEEARLDSYLANLSRRLSTIAGEYEQLLQNIVRQQGNLLRQPQLLGQLAGLQAAVKEKQDFISILRKQLQDAEIQKREKIEEISVVENARGAAPDPQPSVFYKGLIGALIGVLLGGVFAFVLESMDTSIGTIEDVERYIGSVVLGIIPHIETEDIRTRMKVEQFPANVSPEDLNRFARLTTHFDSKSVASESYRTLRTNVNSILTRARKKVLLVTSSVIQEGKTTSCANLAVAFAQTGQKTLLIDTDLRRPIIDKLFGVEKIPGLSDILLGTHGIKECCRSIDDYILGKLGLKAAQVTPGLEYLYIIPAGTSVDNPTELLNSKAMDHLLEEIRRGYDIIILDVSPILPVADAFVLASKVDGVILAYQIGRVAREVLKRSKLRVESIGGTVWGIIMNDIQAEIDYKQGDFQYYHYEYQQGAAGQRQSWTDRIIDRLTGRPGRGGPSAGPRGARKQPRPPQTPPPAPPSAGGSRDSELRDIMSLTNDE